jgi:hypothetical protein
MGVQQISRFWHRRLCEASMLYAVVIVALWAWRHFGGVDQYNLVLGMPLIAVILAGITGIVAAVLHIWPPQQRLGQASLAVYLCAVATTGALIIGTGGLSSPFIAAWLLVAVFAMFFGWVGLALVLLLVNAYLSWGVLSGYITSMMIPSAMLTGELPILVGCLLWGPDDRAAEARTTSYRELAATLSQVAGKSDIVLNAIGDGVMALDADGMIELINPAAQRLVGWGDEDALGLSYQSVLKLIDAKNDPITNDTDPIAAVLADNQPLTTDRLRLVTSSGKTPIISLVISPVSSEPGSGVIVVFRDVTKEKAEERQKAEFISTASHEMRTPVASIEGYLGLTLNPATATIDQRARDFITKAHRSAEHLGRLFQDLLDVSKADDGRLQSNPEAIDLIPFVSDIVEGLRHKAEDKKLQLIFKPRPGTPGGEHSATFTSRTLSPAFYIYVDPDQLREVLDNLVENAIKYTPSGRVTVDVTGGSGRVTIAIADTGIGIPVEDQSHLFQKFYRVDNSDTREIGGTGLGLYLSRRLTEVMGGRLWVESAYRQGSTFFLELPRLSEHDAQTALAAKAKAVAQAAKAAPPRPVPAFATAALQSQGFLPQPSPATRTQHPAQKNNRAATPPTAKNVQSTTVTVAQAAPSTPSSATPPSAPSTSPTAHIIATSQPRRSPTRVRDVLTTPRSAAPPRAVR